MVTKQGETRATLRQVENCETTECIQYEEKKPLTILNLTGEDQVVNVVVSQPSPDPAGTVDLSFELVEP